MDVDRAGSKRGKNHGESSSVALPLLVRFFSSLREVTSSALACHQALSELVEFSRLDGACKQAQMGEIGMLLSYMEFPPFLV
jgi:hypothetical protein